MSTTTEPAAPAVVRAASLGGSIQAAPLTCALGAEVSGVHLGAAARDAATMAEIRDRVLTEIRRDR